MNRPKLLGLAANLNVVQAELDSAGAEFREASKQINSAVVEIHTIAKWNAKEMERMGEVHGWIVASLLGALEVPLDRVSCARRRGRDGERRRAKFDRKRVHDDLHGERKA